MLCFFFYCLFYFILVCFYFLFVSKGRGKEGLELDLWGGGEDLGRDKEGEIVIRIYYMKKIISTNLPSISIAFYLTIIYKNIMGMALISDCCNSAIL